MRPVVAAYAHGVTRTFTVTDTAPGRCQYVHCRKVIDRTKARKRPEFCGFRCYQKHRDGVVPTSRRYEAYRP